MNCGHILLNIVKGRAGAPISGPMFSQSGAPHQDTSNVELTLTSAKYEDYAGKVSCGPKPIRLKEN